MENYTVGILDIVHFADIFDLGNHQVRSILSRRLALMIIVGREEINYGIVVFLILQFNIHRNSPAGRIPSTISPVRILGRKCSRGFIKPEKVLLDDLETVFFVQKSNSFATGTGNRRTAATVATYVIISVFGTEIIGEILGLLLSDFLKSYKIGISRLNELFYRMICLM